jgi:hypothetical protein
LQIAIKIINIETNPIAAKVKRKKSSRQIELSLKKHLLIIIIAEKI